MSPLVRCALALVTVVVVPTHLVGVWKSLKADTAFDRAVMLLCDVVIGGAMWIVLLHMWGVVA